MKLSDIEKNNLRKEMNASKKIILVGGGGHCRSCIDVIETEGCFAIAGIVDVKEKAGQSVLEYKIIGSDEDLPELMKEHKYFLITIGQIKTPELRVVLYGKLKDLGASLPVIISPRAYVSRHSKIGEGTIVMSGAFINAGAKIGKNCIINTGAIVEHDVVVEDYCHISTGTVVNGGAVIRKKTFVGSNAIIREYIEVGENSVVGAGKTVMKTR